MISSFPLMVFAFVLYNGIIFGLGPLVAWDTELFSLNMVSGAVWRFDLGDGMITFGLFLLFFEILKATRIGRLSIVDHLLSTLVLVAFLIEFLLVGSAATSVFFVLMLITFVDVMAGFSVSIRSATRDFNMGEGGGL